MTFTATLTVLLSRLVTLDDAYITFRYARHLAEGYGLGAWNHTGEHVEGYSSPLGRSRNCERDSEDDVATYPSLPQLWSRRSKLRHSFRRPSPNDWRGVLKKVNRCSVLNSRSRHPCSSLFRLPAYPSHRFLGAFKDLKCTR